MLIQEQEVQVCRDGRPVELSSFHTCWINSVHLQSIWTSCKPGCFLELSFNPDGLPHPDSRSASCLNVGVEEER